MANITFPFEQIGDDCWCKKLTDFLAEYEVVVEQYPTNKISDVLGMEVPEEFELYYNNFGSIDRNDYMYNLKKIDELCIVGTTDWEFLLEIDRYEDYRNSDILISESLSGDPICLSALDWKVYLYKHDPIGRHMIFENFSQFVKYEIVNLLELMGDVRFVDRAEKLEFNYNFLPCNEANYTVRVMSL